MKKTILYCLVFSLFTILSPAQQTDTLSQGFFKKKGIEPFLSYASIAASNTSGGLEHASKYAGQLYTGFKFDFEKMLGWNGSRAKLSMINRHGKGLQNEVGSVFEPLNVVGGQNTFLYDLSIEKDFGKKFAFKVGRMTSVDDFSVSSLYYYSLSNTVNGVIRALLLDGLTTTFPFATWGARLKYKPTNKHLFQLGAYQLGKNIFDDTQHGLDFAFRKSDNVSLFFQYDWFGKIANRNTRVYLGTNQVFGSLDTFNSHNNAKNFMRFYGHFDVMMTDGLTTFLTMAYSNQGEIAKVPFQSSFGLNWKGLVKSRSNDRLLFFATVGSYSDEWGILKKNPLSPEVVLEAGYRFQLTNYFVLQPALQYSINPGGSGKIANAVIPGVWIEANF